MNAIVLIGGQSYRLGRNKLIEQIGGSSVIEHVLGCLSDMGQRILLVRSPETTLGFPPGKPPLIEIMEDIYPGKGTLGGLYTGLLASDTEYNMAVAGDMPFLNEGLLRYMVSLAPGFDVVVPRLGGYLEPLYAVYSRNCLVLMREALRQERLSIVDLLPALEVRYVTEDEVNCYDPEHFSFMNINTDADLERARFLAARHPHIHSQKGHLRDNAVTFTSQQPGGEYP